MQRQLHVDRQQVGGSEQGRTVNHGHDAAHGKLPVAEQMKIHQRLAAALGDAAFPPDEQEQGSKGGQQKHGGLQT